MKIESISVASVGPAAKRVLDIAGRKALVLDNAWDSSRGTPVFTVGGEYTTRGWTEWTQGFQFGIPLLAYDGTGDEELLALGRDRTVERMASHVTHVGVHDHGFNNVSTYGNLRRLMLEERIPHNAWELRFYEMALKASGAVQAARWSDVDSQGDVPLGYIYSFNGSHSLFIDTVRTLRSLAVAHQLGHVLMGENDRRISLLGRCVTHALTTRRFNVYGLDNEPRDSYDVRGRVAHEAIFNRNDGRFRCPNSQQGYAPFSTWTRGLAWAVLGFSEQLEFLSIVPEKDFVEAGLPSKSTVVDLLLDAAVVTADFYIEHATAIDGIPYWDTGAPNLHRIDDWQSKPADPFNDFEPVDSSAAAIAAQGLIRLGGYLSNRGERYVAAGLTVASTLFGDTYLSSDMRHEGLLLHSVYHRPNGWDFVPAGRKVPCGESSMWGDYHGVELALLISRLAEGRALRFFETGGAQ
jgi:hypothetical protein